ncbi:peroxisomal bifunctional enzyme isoform X2 [Rhinatrema bivittatum]|uniref:peroxisomal bifunctional enzyme isoform X2 n=1 Tax=Rhinatrema bivittatum TaxID=194408 RepID=UPI001128EF9D|nr:peroxisomal bifunctional enzyme isoform X2 [Rhinatrema bivittatum]
MAAFRHISDAVAVITLSNPPVNALSSALLQAVHKALGEANEDSAVKAIVLCGDHGKFSAGADIREFGQPSKKRGPGLLLLCDLLEGSKKPVVAAIEGVALGGGLELALGCHYRIAHVQARVGFPEVNLGILPAASGTQRLPRLIGISPALSMITTGKFVPATEALKLGIVDEVVNENTVDKAIQLAKKVIDQPLGSRQLSTLPVQCPPNAEALLDEALVKVKKQFRGALSPQACIEALRAAVRLPYSEGIKKEKELFDFLYNTDQPRAQQYAFFAERKVAKWTLPSGVSWKTASPQPIRTAAVIGLGTMGRGIVTSLAKAQIPVIALEQDKKQLDLGSKAVMSLLDREALKMKQLGQSAAASQPGPVQFTLDYSKLKDVDIVIEAAYENMVLKKEIFRRLSAICKPKAFLCTNTSGLDIDEIASVTDRPQMVIGTHFFSPAHIMKLLEVVYGQNTSSTTISTAMHLGKMLGKIGVLVGNCPSFVGNRLMRLYIEQVIFLVEEGSKPEEIDRALEDFGLAMGPFRMMDLSGLDIGWKSRTEIGLTGPNLPTGTPARQRGSKRYSPLPDILCEKGRFGQKSGHGWYKYEKPGDRNAIPDPWLHNFLSEYRGIHNLKSRHISHDEIIDRCLYALINEGFKVLEDGIASGPEDIDVIYNNGYGWPKHKGGPMYYASLVGLPVVLTKLEKYYEANPDIPGLKPSGFLKKLVAIGNPPLKEWQSHLGSQSSKL